jgi:hypothetical protein
LAGIAIGGFALMLALVHFWVGPFAPLRVPKIHATFG